MIWLYRFLYLPGLLIALPYYGLRMWRRGGYGKDFQHRFGCIHQLPQPIAGNKRIWIQAVSVGEVLAIGPLLNALQKNNSIEIVLTTTTSTGYTEARKRYGTQALAIGIFPLDFWLFSSKAWGRIQPDALILTESELWPEHLHQARRRKVPAFLVNARISDRSFSRYQKVQSLAMRMLQKFELIFAASQLDRDRLVSLGANTNKVRTHGSIKFDVSMPALLTQDECESLKRSLGFTLSASKQPFVLLGSSTWPGEEARLLEIQQALIEQGTDCRLLLVPRHAERAPELIKLLSSQSLSWYQRSSGDAPPADLRIHLADTTGELAQLSQAADLAFIGKSLPPHHEGQTPIEAAGLGIPSVMGPVMSNFKDLCRSLVRAGAALQVHDSEQLKARILELSTAPAKLQEMSLAGRTWHSASRGSSQRIAADILACLDA